MLAFNEAKLPMIVYCLIPLRQGKYDNMNKRTIKMLSSLVYHSNNRKWVVTNICEHIRLLLP